MCFDPDECFSGICFYAAFFHFMGQFEENATKVCLSKPAHFHECTNADDCGLETNPLVNSRQAFSMYAGYLTPKVELFCHSSDMLITGQYDLADDQNDNMWRGILTAVVEENIWTPLGHVNVPEKVCFAPLDLYPLYFGGHFGGQFAACTEDNHCLSGECNQATGECRRFANGICSTDEDCISRECVKVLMAGMVVNASCAWCNKRVSISLPINQSFIVKTTFASSVMCFRWVD